MSVEPTPRPYIVDPPQPVYRWYHKVAAVIFIVFCLEIGVVLLVLPWSEYWDNNFFANFLTSWALEWTELWRNAYFRGAVSGLGIINIVISVSELFRMRRFHASGEDEEAEDGAER